MANRSQISNAQYLCRYSGSSRQISRLVPLEIFRLTWFICFAFPSFLRNLSFINSLVSCLREWKLVLQLQTAHLCFNLCLMTVGWNHSRLRLTQVPFSVFSCPKPQRQNHTPAKHRRPPYIRLNPRLPRPFCPGCRYFLAYFWVSKHQLQNIFFRTEYLIYAS